MIYVVSPEGIILHEYPDALEADVRRAYTCDVIRRDPIPDWDGKMIQGDTVTAYVPPKKEIDPTDLVRPSREEIERAEMTLRILEVLDDVGLDTTR